MIPAQSKGKGKGKARKESAEGGKGHLLPRARLSAEKFAGTVVNWRGKYGFIKPSEEIEHEKASLRSGNLFACIDDLLGVQALEVGAPVSFHISEDESGLVAEEVEQTGPGNPAAAKGKGKSAAKGGAKGGWEASAWGGKADGGWGGAAGGWGGAAKGGPKGWSVATGMPVFSGITKTTFAQGAGKGMDKGKGKGKDGKGKEGHKGHLLPRTRISEEKFTGTVADWKGKYGWIEPSEAIEHEKATKHGGKLFVGKDDLVGVEELTPGSVVEFHVWEDASGLGADEVIQS